MSRREFLRQSIGATGALLAYPAAAVGEDVLGSLPGSFRMLPCEEHFTVAAVENETARLAGRAAAPRAFLDVLLDLGEGRIKAMDASGIQTQILSLATPGVQRFESATAVSLARAANDELADAVKANPGRLAGLAAFAPQDPSAAAEELQRAAETLGLRGAVVHSHTNGEYLDDRKYWEIFEAAEALDLPIYLHPRDPSENLAGPALAIPGFRIGWSFGVETATHALRIMGAGVFDAFPKLRIILGHMGETLPFAIFRIDERYRIESRSSSVPKLKRTPKEYLTDNFLITTSGMNYWPALQATIQIVGIDNVLFAVDYPFEDGKSSAAAMRGMPLSDVDKRQICELNARRVFRL